MDEISTADSSAWTDHPDVRKLAASAHTLALLNEQVASVRAELAILQRDLAEARRDFNGVRPAELLEANEQLVLAALQAESVAETAVSDLDQLTHSSQRDALTGTPNRALMLHRLETAIAMAQRHKMCIAVLFLDIDRFKEINDTLGHAVGDEVLQLVARRLESVLRHSDAVSRHGGDEFLVLLAETSHASDAALIAEKMLAAVAAPSRVGEHELHLSASIGISVYPEHGEDVAALISYADAAMYRAKKRGHGSFELHGIDSLDDRNLPPVKVEVPRHPANQHESVVAAHEPHLQNLREANEQLVIAALTAQEMEAKVSAAHRQQINFLAMVAHELRNPLTPIRTAAELLKRARTDDPLLTRLQVIIKRQVAHISRLVDDLLDGSRIDNGKFRLEHSLVEIADIISAAVDMCRPAINKKLQQLQIRLPPRPLSVDGDAIRLTQILSNLLDNANKYTPNGGEIVLAVEVVGDKISISVSDNGIGITPDVLPNIFELFVRDNCAQALHRRGLGIGLAVVRELVEAHGGTITGKSPGNGLGSEFTVTLSMAETTTADPAVMSERYAARSQTNL
jgi:diguanylate cyclase